MPEGYIVLEFTSTSTGAEGHRVYRSTSPMNPNALPPPLASLPASADQYIDYDFADESAAAENLYYRVSDFWRNTSRVSEEMSLPNPGNVLSPDSPTWLFGGGESGFANTLGVGTLFTDTDGTTPVEEYGDTIALATNLADDGPDMIQETGSERPVYGQMPVVRVRNLLTYTEDFSNAAWIKTNVTVSAAAAPDGSMTAAKLVVDSGTDGSQRTRLVQQENAVAGSSRRNLIVAKAGECRYLNVGVAIVSSNNYIIAQFDLQAGTVVSYRARGGIYAADGGPTITPHEMGGGWYECRMGGTPLATTGMIGLSVVGSNVEMPSESDITLEQSFHLTNDGTSGVYIWHPQFADADYPYQKVTARYDVTQSGTPSVPIAYLDTSDDNFSWTLPAGTYHLFIAGEKGCYFDTVVHAGGEFTVGPTTWTGAKFTSVTVHPPLTQLVGQRYVIVPVILDREFTQFEKEQMVAYAMARGCPGVWNESAELFTGTITLGDGWSDNGGGSYTHTAGSEGRLITENSVDAGNIVLCSFTISGQTSGLTGIVTNVSDSVATMLGSNGRKYQLGTVTATGLIAVRSTSSSDATVSDISLKQLTLESTPT